MRCKACDNAIGEREYCEDCDRQALSEIFEAEKQEIDQLQEMLKEALQWLDTISPYGDLAKLRKRIKSFLDIGA